MISLNYVNTEDQSLYQVGKDDSEDPDPAEDEPENRIRQQSVHFLKTERKGGSRYAENENL